MFEKLKSWFSASAKPITAGYNPGPSMLFWAYTNKRPPWTYYYADIMLLDPQVWFGINIGNGPLLSAKVTVKPGPKLKARSDAAEIQEFVAQQWQRIWSTSAQQIMRAKHYGFMAYEVVCKENDGRIEFAYLRDFHPFDVGELKLTGGGRVGVRIHNIARPGGGSVDLYGPKGLWITYDDEFCRTWGRALLQRAYAPWYDKNSEGGAFDLRRLRNFKDAWIGDTIRYPLKQIRTPNGQLVSGRDLAREIGENRASGAPIFLPSTRDQNGDYEWDYTPPQSIAGDSGIPEWIGDLDWDILDGLLVPREVVEASQTGSGFSGRSVPLVGFLAIRDTEFGSYVRQINGQFLQQLALASYGPGADDYDLVPTPLIETTGELMGGMGQPDSRNAGGDGAGQDGKGKEAGGVDQGSGFGVQGSGKQSGGMQFGQGSLWGEEDEREHPRAANGRWIDKSGGAGSRASISGEAFRLNNNRKGKVRYENVKTKQKKLLDGMDALAGQQDLFDEHEHEHAATPPPPVEKRSYTTFQHPEEGYLDLRRLQILKRPEGLELVESYKEEVHTTPVKDEEEGYAALHRRIRDLTADGWKHSGGPSGGPLRPDGSYHSRRAEQFSDDAGHWITIGAVPGADGKRHGGTPVKIVGGKIVSGPKRLRGKSIKRLASGKPNHNVEYRRAVKKAVKEHGVKEEHLHDAIEFVHGERKIHHDAREAAKEDARKLTGLTAADVSRLSNSGHDYASGKKAGGLAGEKLRHFDEFAQELAKTHPELGLGDSDDAAAGLWSVLGEGKRSMVAKHDPEVINEAVRLIHASGGHNYADEDADVVPFSVDENGRRHRPPGSPEGGEFESDKVTDLRHGGSVGRTGGKMTLYRASDDDYIGDSASFATSRNNAEAYLDNPGFGGSSLYKARVNIDPSRALDLYESQDPLSDLVKFLGIKHPGAISADEFAPRVSDKLSEAGIDWVRVKDSFPEDAETWIFVGGEEPELREIEDLNQFSVADPPSRDQATSKPAKAKLDAAAAGSAVSAEIRRRLDKLLKKND